MKKLKKLPKKFYNQNTFKLATSLLGKYLIRKIGRQLLIGKIVETEAYYGPHDKASHASRGKTERTKLMFDKPGTAYIYLVYGMYYCFNIVTESPNFPAAILIRALEPISGLKQMSQNRKIKIKTSKLLTFPRSGMPLRGLDFILYTSLANGPAKLCQALKIDKKLNGLDLITSDQLYLAENPSEKIKPSQIKCAKRIGIDYAGAYRHKLWRFYLKNNKFVSKS